MLCCGSAAKRTPANKGVVRRGACTAAWGFRSQCGALCRAMPPQELAASSIFCSLPFAAPYAEAHTCCAAGAGLDVRWRAPPPPWWALAQRLALVTLNARWHDVPILRRVSTRVVVVVVGHLGWRAFGRHCAGAPCSDYLSCSFHCSLQKGPKASAQVTGGLRCLPSPQNPHDYPRGEPPCGSVFRRHRDGGWRSSPSLAQMVSLMPQDDMHMVWSRSAPPFFPRAGGATGGGGVLFLLEKPCRAALCCAGVGAKEAAQHAAWHGKIVQRSFNGVLAPRCMRRYKHTRV